MSDIKAILGARIRKLRKEKRLSQEALAEKADLHYTFIGEVERGEKNISIVSLEKLAKALSVSLKDLFDLLGQEESPERTKQLLLEGLNQLDLEDTKALLQVINRIKSYKSHK